MKSYIKITLLIVVSIFFITSSACNKNHKINIAQPIKNNNDEVVHIPLNGYITSYFGYRIHPITNNLDFHPAIDISAPYKNYIHTILPGKVKEIGNSDIDGNYIIISHKNNIESKYCHCDKIFKKENNHVTQGQIISTVGHTGLATGNHLHLEIKINNINIDPLLLINFK